MNIFENTKYYNGHYYYGYCPTIEEIQDTYNEFMEILGHIKTLSGLKAICKDYGNWIEVNGQPLHKVDENDLIDNIVWYGYGCLESIKVFVQDNDKEPAISVDSNIMGVFISNATPSDIPDIYGYCVTEGLKHPISKRTLIESPSSIMAGFNKNAFIDKPCTIYDKRTGRPLYEWLPRGCADEAKEDTRKVSQPYLLPVDNISFRHLGRPYHVDSYYVLDTAYGDLLEIE